MKVKELIQYLGDFNQEAELFVGDNVNNGISVSWCGGDLIKDFRKVMKGDGE